MKRTVLADKKVESVVNGGFMPILIDMGGSGASADKVKRYEDYVTPTTIIADAIE